VPNQTVDNHFEANVRRFVKCDKNPGDAVAVTMATTRQLLQITVPIALPILVGNPKIVTEHRQWTVPGTEHLRDVRRPQEDWSAAHSIDPD
jgi:hypothetical protein